MARRSENVSISTIKHLHAKRGRKIENIMLSPPILQATGGIKTITKLNHKFKQNEL